MKRVLVGMAAVLTGFLLPLPGSAIAGGAVSASDVYHFPYHTVYVEDHTSPDRWPVEAAVNSWDYQTPYLHVVYGDCRPDAGCIKVHAEFAGDTGWVGLTEFSDVSGQAFVGTNRVTLNNNYLYYPWSLHRQTTCHEIGHALGLAYHRYTLPSDSCMYYAASDQASNRPGDGDRYWLNRAYAK